MATRRQERREREAREDRTRAEECGHHNRRIERHRQSHEWPDAQACILFRDKRFLCEKIANAHLVINIS